MVTMPKEIKYRLTYEDVQRLTDWCNENGHKLGRLKARTKTKAKWRKNGYQKGFRGTNNKNR